MQSIHPIFLKDFYKVGHFEQYPKDTTLVFSNFTARKSRMDGVDYSVFFGIEYFIQEYLTRFAQASEEDVKGKHAFYVDFMRRCLNSKQDFPHIKALLEMSYLPIQIHALPEGAEVPCGVPSLVIFNTHPAYCWLPNMLETLLSATLWGPCTSATHANRLRKLLDHYAEETASNPGFVDYQAHDFSFRGMYGVEAAILSGAAHLLYFKGTDCIPAILFSHIYKGATVLEEIGCSVPATEHAVMSAGGIEGEKETFRRLIQDIYPTGIVSIVADTWNLWHVVDNIMWELKDVIMARDGKVVLRPDSGDPYEIICGTVLPEEFGRGRNKKVGVMQLLWEMFGGTMNDKGFKELDPHIGLIYGDSITYEKAEAILDGLKQLGFASTNIVFGIGSYTYQFNTRDTLGFAMKATYCEVNGEGRDIYKNPITDDGTKKSHKGLLKVIKEDGIYKCLQGVTWDDFKADDNELKMVYQNGRSYL
jgi:nicotinamide phosphoribosyltransferase